MASNESNSTSGKGQAPEAVTGVQLMQGIGVSQARGFWAEAWSYVLKRRAAVVALGWLGIVAFFAVFGPIIANGHPIVMWDEATGKRSFPLRESLEAVDLAVMIGAAVGLVFIFAVPWSRRSRRLGIVLWGATLIGLLLLIVGLLQSQLGQRDLAEWARALKQRSNLRYEAPLAAGAIVAVIGLLVPFFRFSIRVPVVIIAIAIGVYATSAAWTRPAIQVFDFQQREARGEIRAVYTLIPWSPTQGFSALNRMPPMTTLGEGLNLPEGTVGANRTFILGTDALGQDVLAQVLTASRLAISIGLVSTGIAVLIGVTLGALMGYFGGWVDLVLYRVVEVFMAVPLLFLLIVAAAVLPDELRSTYVMMAIIGCFTWTGAARFTRAEFMKLRNQDFVQSAKSVGLPLRSILFKHMLPNGVTPVLVDASFAIAAAITIEATLSYLGLGPVGQPSWGKVLSYATNSEGEFKWWLAVFPGVAIFLTVLSYNIIGEALRDAIDPKLKKARV